jgi:type I restriction enzyme, S subunit
MLRFSDLEQIEMPIPPLAEQRRIVGILDEASALTQLRLESDEKAELLPAAIYVHLFGDPITNPRGWPTSPLGELIDEGPQNGLYKHASFYGEGVRILRIDSFSDGEIKDTSALKRIKATEDEVAHYALRPGDLIVNRVNSPELLGKSVLIRELDEPTIFESNMMRFSVLPQKANPEYIAWLLQTDLAKQHILGRAKRAIGQSSINQTDVRTLAIPIPPLPLQQEFASQIMNLRRLRTSRLASAARLGDLTHSLMDRAFQGDL